ncbi:hypothetical protein FB451DRAFT_1274591 [Mycena latifolia]|nr:hypothetical protein FB451DRAFT_1274591 [Mycena latifolia]
MSPSSRSTSFALVLTCLAAVLNVYLLVASPHTALTPPSTSHTYIGDDFPELWPVSSSDSVLLTAEETRWYPLHGPFAQELWATSSSKGFGYVRLGPAHRAFAVAIFHQLHCVRLMRGALDGRYDDVARGHMHHCLNYIRQMILCSPDLTLEPPDVLDRDFEVQRAGATHVCNDWSVMYADAAKNWEEWFGIVKANASLHSNMPLNVSLPS